MIGTAAPTNTKKHKQMQHHAQIGNPRLRRFFSSSSFVSSSSFSNGSTSVVAFDRLRTPSSSLMDCTDFECSVGVSSSGTLKTVFESMCKHTSFTVRCSTFHSPFTSKEQTTYQLYSPSNAKSSSSNASNSSGISDSNEGLADVEGSLCCTLSSQRVGY